MKFSVMRYRNARRVKTAREVMNEAEPEVDLMNKTITFARLRGWLVYHSRPAQDRRGKFSTPMQGDQGFPDLIFLRNGRMVVTEFKAEGKQPTVNQAEWLAQFLMVEHVVGALAVSVHTVHPSDWERFIEVLR